MGWRVGEQVERVSRNGDVVEVSLTQVFGTSLHRVQKLTELGSSYRVDVGGAVALVRGTVFAVGYVPPQRVLYSQEAAIRLVRLHRSGRSTDTANQRGGTCGRTMRHRARRRGVREQGESHPGRQGRKLPCRSWHRLEPRA